MRRCVSSLLGRASAVPLAALIISASTSHGDTPAAVTNQRTNAANSSTRIECIPPDGKVFIVSQTQTADRSAGASIIDDETVSCALHDGETTFIIALPGNGLRDRFTFLNENAAACGELRIAVSDSLLPAESPKWTEVDGIIPFAHKRLFNLSMLGVDTRFVRLSFRVESLKEHGTAQNLKAAPIPDPFRKSALADAIDAHFIKLQAPRREDFVSVASVSVAPLSFAPNE